MPTDDSDSDDDADDEDDDDDHGDGGQRQTADGAQASGSADSQRNVLGVCYKLRLALLGERLVAILLCQLFEAILLVAILGFLESKVLYLHSGAERDVAVDPHLQENTDSNRRPDVHCLDPLLVQPVHDNIMVRIRDVASTRYVENVLLLVLHPLNILLETNNEEGLRRREPEELDQLLAIDRVLISAKLQVISKERVELGIDTLALGQVLEHLQTFPNKKLPQYTHLVFTNGSTHDVKGDVRSVDDAPNHVQPGGQEVIATVRNVSITDIQLQLFM